MGYRTYLGSISKDRYNKIKDLKKEEMYKYFDLDEKEDYLSNYDLLEQVNLFGFGKYEEFGTDDYIFEQMDFEGDCVEVSKEELLRILDNIRGRVQKAYKELLFAQTSNLTRKKLRKIHDREMEKKFENIDFELINRCDRLKYITPKGYVEQDIKGKIRAWKSMDNISGSWLWEYEFFNLREIYNNFDFDKNILVYYGY